MVKKFPKLALVKSYGGFYLTFELFDGGDHLKIMLKQKMFVGIKTIIRFKYIAFDFAIYSPIHNTVPCSVFRILKQYN